MTFGGRDHARAIRHKHCVLRAACSIHAGEVTLAFPSEREVSDGQAEGRVAIRRRFIVQGKCRVFSEEFIESRVKSPLTFPQSLGNMPQPVWESAASGRQPNGTGTSNRFMTNREYSELD